MNLDSKRTLIRLGDVAANAAITLSVMAISATVTTVICFSLMGLKGKY